MSTTTPPPRPLLRRLSSAGVGTLLAMTIGVLLVLAVVGIGLALIANGELTHTATCCSIASGRRGARR
jgi:hypothetical protein